MTVGCIFLPPSLGNDHLRAELVELLPKVLADKFNNDVTDADDAVRTFFSVVVDVVVKRFGFRRHRCCRRRRFRRRVGRRNRRSLRQRRLRKRRRVGLVDAVGTAGLCRRADG